MHTWLYIRWYSVDRRITPTPAIPHQIKTQNHTQSLQHKPITNSMHLVRIGIERESNNRSKWRGTDSPVSGTVGLVLFERFAVGMERWVVFGGCFRPPFSWQQWCGCLCWWLLLGTARLLGPSLQSKRNVGVAVFIPLHSIHFYSIQSNSICSLSLLVGWGWDSSVFQSFSA